MQSTKREGASDETADAHPLSRADSLGLVTKSSSVFVENPTTAEQFIYGDDGTVYGKIVSTAVPITSATVCWFCNQSSHPELLYQPCRCASYIHRHCFRSWRCSWINPRNYFSCPNCLHSYNLERVKPETTQSKERMRRNYRISLVKLWVAVIIGYGAMVSALAGISYGADTAEKNIPVAVKFLLSSVVSGLPNSNSTAEWHEEFKLPNVHVWPYYTAFGLFLTSIVILTSFAFLGCTFDERDRRRAGHCNCCDDCSDGGCNTAIAVGNCNNCCSYRLDCHNCCREMGSANCDGGGDLGPVVAVIVLVVVVIVIFSALFVAILFTIQKCSLLYDRYTAMIDAQQSELEGETVVLGINESWRPNDAV